LLLLADEYLLPELKLRCEDDIVSKLTPDNVLDMLISSFSFPFQSSAVVNECKDLFVKEFASISEREPDLEIKLASVPGLTTQLFAHFHRFSKKTKKRRVTFRLNENVVDTVEDISTLNSGYSSAASSYT